MYLVDYHTHSLCSQDSDAPLADMAQAAAEAGVSPTISTSSAATASPPLTQTGPPSSGSTSRSAAPSPRA